MGIYIMGFSGGAVATARSSPLNTQGCSQTKWRQHSRSTKERGQADVFEPGSRPTPEAVDFKVKRGIHDPMADSTNCTSPYFFLGHDPQEAAPVVLAFA